MKKQYYQYVHISVGILMLLGLICFVFLAIKVSGMADFGQASHYSVSAEFSNIGGLKVRAPITVAGVKVGEVTKIELIPNTLNAQVTMSLYNDQPIPYEDASARILTEGLLGSNYISIVPGFDSSDPQHQFLREGDVITKTQEALVLENLIGQLVFNIKK
ncbi:MAG: outer membrane lipid asymmetry maintenance protein MlaD [Legionellales bacterium]|jgi:phospholipid/cholesterol/gamma-HCH transport system substrate-binding protein|nr:outer membrane lipid asymmetry maintenance protein MlaD [Legionellales bacterium]